ncbi:MAG: tellurite resistance TerB family protein [Pseudomonadota bacterium]
MGEPMLSDDSLLRRLVEPREAAKAVLVPAVHTLVIDGALADAEIAQLENLCAASPIFAPYDGADLRAMFGEIASEMGEDPAAQLEDVSRALALPLRETAFAFAARVALADGSVGEAEQSMLDDLARALGIAPATVNTIFDVVEILQRRPDCA